MDFKIHEPSPFNSAYYSHKFKSAGLRYEIGICIRTGEIVWGYGGYPCGAYPDLKLTRVFLTGQLDPNEKVLADRGYNDPNYFILPNPTNSSRHNKIMSRHETVNGRIKTFKILSNTFRHDKEKHAQCFHAVLNITAVVIKTEEPLFSVE